MIWPVKKLGDILSTAEIFTDGDWVESKDQDVNGSIRLLQLADIGDGNFINKSNRFINESTFIRLKCTEVQLGDILIARMPDPLGRACIFEGISQKCITVVDVCIIRVDSNIVDARWLMHAINNDSVRRQISSFAKGATRVRISRKNLSHIQIEFPPLAEQQRIAELLDTADRILKQRESAIAKLDQLAQSVFVEMFQKHIKKLKLKDTCSFVSGGTPSKDEPKFWGGDVAWISSADIEGDHVKEIRHFVTESAINNSATNPILPNNILVVTRTGVGKVVVTDRKICFSQDITGLVLQKEFMPEFIAASIRNKQDEIVKQARGATIKGVTRDVIANVEIPAASFLEQQEFSEIIKTIDLQKKNFEIDRIKINDLLSSLQHQSFAVN